MCVSFQLPHAVAYEDMWASGAMTDAVGTAADATADIADAAHAAKRLKVRVRCSHVHVGVQQEWVCVWLSQ